MRGQSYPAALAAPGFRVFDRARRSSGFFWSRPGEYEAFVEMAEAELGRISEEVAQKFSLGSVIVHHRIGFVPAGQASLFVRVSAHHRGAAFAGSQHLVELLKSRVPIWKHPIPAKSHSA
jgi:molybdopterin synthase catalytic subunit